MSELRAALARLEVALREAGSERRAVWAAEQAARADADPGAVSAEVRARLGGMGSLNDEPIDGRVLRQVRAAVGDLADPGAPRRMVRAQPGGPIDP